MDRKLVREFRERWQAVAAAHAEEQRASSVDLRWRQLNAVLRLAMGLGIALPEFDEEDEIVRQRWTRLKAGQP